MPTVAVSHRSPGGTTESKGRLLDVGVSHIVSVSAGPEPDSGLYEVRLTNTTIYVDRADRRKILDALG